jgi:septal ring factor EnvC (AmiA/AmiB activator)
MGKVFCEVRCWPWLATFVLCAALVAQPSSPGAQTSAETEIVLIPPSEEETEALASRRQERAKELSDIEEAIALSQETINALESEVEIIQADRENLNQALIEAAARVQALEQRIIATENELEGLGVREDKIRLSLAERRELLGQVLAALQRMGRNPPPALLIGPSDALESVRSAILMGAVVPEMRDEANALLTDLTELRSLVAEQEESRALFSDQIAAIKEENARVALLIEEKQNLESEVARQLAAERERTDALAARAGSLNELITALETEIDAARQAAEDAAKADAERKAQQERLLAERDAEAARLEQERLERLASANTARLSPAIAFSEAKGRIRLPAAGNVIKAFGAQSEFLDQTQGILFATRPAATIVTPADGWVVFAGEYRSFGQLVILNAGDDHHIVMAGLDSTDVTIGQFLLSGEPIGRMGETKLASAASLDVPSSRPVLYIEFRKDGVPIDPTPWWADRLNKRETNDS